LVETHLGHRIFKTWARGRPGMRVKGKSGKKGGGYGEGGEQKDHTVTSGWYLPRSRGESPRWKRGNRKERPVEKKGTLQPGKGLIAAANGLGHKKRGAWGKGVSGGVRRTGGQKHNRFWAGGGGGDRRQWKRNVGPTGVQGQTTGWLPVGEKSGSLTSKGGGALGFKTQRKVTGEKSNTKRLRQSRKKHQKCANLVGEKTGGQRGNNQRGG